MPENVYSVHCLRHFNCNSWGTEDQLPEYWKDVLCKNDSEICRSQRKLSEREIVLNQYFYQTENAIEMFV